MNQQPQSRDARTAIALRVQPRAAASSRRGFTLIELLVVIMLIGILAAILAPAVGSLLGGRSVGLSRNALDGYFGGLRAEAVNRNRPILIVGLPSSAGQSYTLVGDGGKSFSVTGGFVAFSIDTRANPDAPIHEKIRHLGRDFILLNELSNDATFHPKKEQTWTQAKLPESLGLKPQNLKAIGIPDNAWLIYVGPDGRAVIPGDVPGYLADSAKDEILDGDIVLEGKSEIAILDLSTLLKVRGQSFSKSRYKGLYSSK